MYVMSSVEDMQGILEQRQHWSGGAGEGEYQFFLFHVSERQWGSLKKTLGLV